MLTDGFAIVLFLSPSVLCHPFWFEEGKSFNKEIDEKGSAGLIVSSADKESVLFFQDYSLSDTRQ